LRGCDDGVFVKVATSYAPSEVDTIRACLNGHCATWTAGGAISGDTPRIAAIGFGLMSSADAFTVRLIPRDPAALRAADVVALTITTTSGAVIVDWTHPVGYVKREQPNGPDCGPVCYRAELAAR
jgi:hypothetical protein